MAFTVTRTTSAAPEDVWRRVSDLARHTQHVPLTTVAVPESGVRLGAEVRARTALGPVGFVDAMLVTRWEPPRVLRIVKTGRLLAGWAEITVEPHGQGSHVTWHEELWLRGARRVTAGLGDVAGPRLFAGVLDALLGSLPGESLP